MSFSQREFCHRLPWQEERCCYINSPTLLYSLLGQSQNQRGYNWGRNFQCLEAVSFPTQLLIRGKLIPAKGFGSKSIQGNPLSSPHPLVSLSRRKEKNRDEPHPATSTVELAEEIGCLWPISSTAERRGFPNKISHLFYQHSQRGKIRDANSLICPCEIRGSAPQHEVLQIPHKEVASNPNSLQSKQRPSAGPSLN